MILALSVAAILLAPDITTTQDRVLKAPAPPPQGAMTAYLKIPDIDGESERAGGTSNGPVFTRGNADGAASKGHDKWITIESATFDVSASAPPRRAKMRELTVVKKTDSASAETMAGQRPASDARSGDVVVVKEVDASTGSLIVRGNFPQCEVGERVPNMEVGAEGGTYLLTDVTVIECAKVLATSGDADDRPTEEVAFYYNKITFSYAKRDMVVKGKKILQN